MIEQTEILGIIEYFDNISTGNKETVNLNIGAQINYNGYRLLGIHNVTSQQLNDYRKQFLLAFLLKLFKHIHLRRIDKNERFQLSNSRITRYPDHQSNSSLHSSDNTYQLEEIFTGFTNIFDDDDLMEKCLEQILPTLIIGSSTAGVYHRFFSLTSVS